MGTVRRQMIDLLQKGAMTALEISRALGVPEKEVYRHLVHVEKTVVGQGGTLTLTPCTCQACGFTFKARRRLTRPGRCPRCRQSRIDHPVFTIGASDTRKGRMKNRSPQKCSHTRATDQGAIQDSFCGEHAICYGCGPDNPHGLHVRTLWDGQTGTFRFTPRDYHTAFPGVVYGGLIASLFDCHCIATAIAAAYDADGRAVGTPPAIMFVTANLNVTYRRPTPMDRELTLTARVTETKGRKSVVAATLTVDDVACATATVVAVRTA